MNGRRKERTKGRKGKEESEKDKVMKDKTKRRNTFDVIKVKLKIVKVQCLLSGRLMDMYSKSIAIHE